MSDENKRNQKLIEEDDFIDFVKIFKDLLKHKKLYYKVLLIAFIIAALFSLSLPNYYSCSVKLAPELGRGSKSSSLGGLASLASSFGVNIGGSGNGVDAISPNLYPDLMNSVDFKTSLFPIKVTRKEDGKSFSYYDYMENEQKYPWWTSILRLIFNRNEIKTKSIDVFQLTKEQTDIIKKINKNITCTVDKKTFVITINVIDQDPLICATLADSVKTRLQNFITEYRTSKARVDLEYNKKIFAEAKEKYEQARKSYAAYADAHRNATSQSAQTKESDLQAEMQMQQTIYQQVVAQLQQAEMKVQEDTPAFTTLQSATVPVRKAGPKRAQLCLIFLFLAFLGISVYILYKEDDLKSLLGLE